MRTAVAVRSPEPIASLAGWVAGEIVEVKAQRPGLIDRVAAARGGLVAEGDLLISLEAGRLDVRAPVSGRVLDVCVSAGQRVEAGQVLALILRDDYTFVVATFAGETLRRFELARASVQIGALRIAARLQMVAHGEVDVAMLTLDARSRSGLRPGQNAAVYIERADGCGAQ